MEVKLNLLVVGIPEKDKIEFKKRKLKAVFTIDLRVDIVQHKIIVGLMDAKAIWGKLQKMLMSRLLGPELQHLYLNL